MVIGPGGAEEAAALAGGCRVVHHSDPREALWRLAEARWRTSELPLKIVGVTGTNGKTTCSYLLEQLFAQAQAGGPDNGNPGAALDAIREKLKLLAPV